MKFEDCGKEYRRDNAARHRKSSVRGVLSCPECNYCTYNQQKNELSCGQEACPINFQAINGLFVLPAGVSELLVSPTASEKRTWGETTEAK